MTNHERNARILFDTVRRKNKQLAYLVNLSVELIEAVEDDNESDIAVAVEKIVTYLFIETDLHEKAEQSK